MARIENPGRERILARIRTALKTTAPVHWTSEVTRDGQPIFAPIRDVLQRFERECAGHHTELIVTPESRATREALNSVLASLPAGEITGAWRLAVVSSKVVQSIRQGSLLEPV